MPASTTPLSAHDLSQFRAIQRLAYQCAETIAGELKPGINKKEATALVTNSDAYWLDDDLPPCSPLANPRPEHDPAGAA